MQEYRIDEYDIYILRILARNCRASYRSISLDLGITTNTVKNRIKNLIENKIIQRYVIHINYAILGYKKNCLVILHDNISPLIIIEKFNTLGSVYLHVDCLGGTSVFGIVFKESMDDLESLLSSAIRPATLRNIFAGDLETRAVALTTTDLRIIKYLLSEPRMKNEDIARLMSVSQKTVKRRLEFMIRNHVLDFGIVYNPSAMKGYIYFGLIIQTDHYQYQRVLEQVYLNFERYLLRHPDTLHKDVIILNMYSRNIYDIESILRTVESFDGVSKAEIFQTLKTEILDKWVIEEINNSPLLKYS
jgi:DNA-binding Lrp family transcriptional regulator